jgi:hypothetical protein
MKIRHCVEKSNVETTSLIIMDPSQIRHAVIKSGKISSLSGLIDPKSHLNLDYPPHLVKNCIIAEKFELGSAVEISDGSFIFAQINPDNYQHLGKYDYTQNLMNMIESVKKLRNMNTDITTNTDTAAHETKSSPPTCDSDKINNNIQNQ